MCVLGEVRKAREGETRKHLFMTYSFQSVNWTFAECHATMDVGVFQRFCSESPRKGDTSQLGTDPLTTFLVNDANPVLGREGLGRPVSPGLREGRGDCLVHLLSCQILLASCREGKWSLKPLVRKFFLGLNIVLNS